MNEDTPDLDHARDELREGIENSRELIRQSRVLIALSECDGTPSFGEGEYATAN